MDTRAAYDLVAADYAAHYQDEMDHKPFDRDCLDRLIRAVGGLGPICDLGCGPGQIARYLRARGAATLGVDLSPQMVAEAARLNPAIPFHQGDMLSLPDADGAWGGIAAFYCIIHIPREQVAAALGEMRRVLRPGGTLLLTFHVGDRVQRVEQWWDKQVDLDFMFYRSDEMEAWLRQAGFELVQTLERDPNPAVEKPTRRSYIFARRPA